MDNPGLQTQQHSDIWWVAEHIAAWTGFVILFFRGIALNVGVILQYVSKIMLKYVVHKAKTFKNIFADRKCILLMTHCPLRLWSHAFYLMVDIYVKCQIGQRCNVLWLDNDIYNMSYEYVFLLHFSDTLSSYPSNYWDTFKTVRLNEALSEAPATFRALDQSCGFFY